MEIDEAAVADFGLYLGAEAGQTLPTIETLARDEGMSDHGFTGLLEPLGDIVNGDASVLVGSAFSLMQRKLCDLGDSVLSAAKEYGYTEDSNVTMFERTSLNLDNDADITFGAGFENHTEGGSSNFLCSSLDIGEIDRPNTRYSDDIDDTGPVLDVLDWIWREFEVDGDKGFTDSLISPLAGNYKSIEANGEAWTSVGTNFGLMAANLLTNAGTLAADHWKGDAAEAFKQFLDLFWKKGAVWAGEQLGTFVAAGFNKIAEVSKQIAGLAIDAINVIIRAAVRIAAKAIPVVGWAWTAIQSLGKWGGKLIGVDIDDLYDDIMEIVNTAQAVFELFQAMESLVESMKNYFTTLEELIDTVKTIPEIGSLTDAVETAESIEASTDALNDQTKALEESTAAADDALTELDSIGANAGN